MVALSTHLQEGEDFILQPKKGNNREGARICYGNSVFKYFFPYYALGCTLLYLFNHIAFTPSGIALDPL